MDNAITNMRDLARCFGRAMNLVSPKVENHHQQVAYVSWRIADEMGYDLDDRREIIYGALMHDMGSVIMPEKEDGEGYSLREMSQPGISLIGDIPKLRFIKDILSAYQVPYEERPDFSALSKEAIFAEIIFLADKISMMINPTAAALNQAEDVCDTISDYAGEDVHPEIVEAFLRTSSKEYVWLELLHQPEICLNAISNANVVTLDQTIELAKFMSRIIDFRSQYTAMHSSGVAATAVRLAEILGMSEDECKMMMIAGYIHDIGKLKVPKKILEKKEKLTDEDFNIVKEYAYYTELLLKDIAGFDQIGRWAALHHEKLNGFGYPFGLKADDIPMGARIIAVADIFSAVAEIRSYRDGMSKEQVIFALREYVESSALSKYIVDLMIANYDDIYQKRESETSKEGARYYAAVVDMD